MIQLLTKAGALTLDNIRKVGVYNVGSEKMGERKKEEGEKVSSNASLPATTFR